MRLVFLGLQEARIYEYQLKSLKIFEKFFFSNSFSKTKKNLRKYLIKSNILFKNTLSIFKKIKKVLKILAVKILKIFKSVCVYIYI